MQSYDDVLRYLVAWADGLSLWSLTVDDLFAFVNRPRYDKHDASNVKPGANATLRREGGMVKVFYKWVMLFYEDISFPKQFGAYLDDWDTGKVTLNNPNPIADDTFLALWDACVNEDDQLWLGLAYLLGFRRIEMAMLDPVHVHPTDGSMKFARKGDWDNWHTLVYGEVLHDELSPFMPQLRPAITTSRGCDG